MSATFRVHDTPNLPDPQESPEMHLEPSSPEWNEKKEDTKLLMPSAVRALKALNFEWGVIHDTGLPENRLILREARKPPQILLINFTASMAGVETEVVHEDKLI